MGLHGTTEQDLTFSEQHITIICLEKNFFGIMLKFMTSLIPIFIIYISIYECNSEGPQNEILKAKNSLREPNGNQ